MRRARSVHHLFFSRRPACGKEHFYVGTQRLASAQQKQQPRAEAGVDQSADAKAPVTLDGSASSDAEGAITYAWQQTSGPTVQWHGAPDTAIAGTHAQPCTSSFKLIASGLCRRTKLKNLPT